MLVHASPFFHNKLMIIWYSADLLPKKDGGYCVIVNHAQFSEDLLFVQEWHTSGDDQEDAVDMARDLIITMAESFILHFAPELG